MFIKLFQYQTNDNPILAFIIILDYLLGTCIHFLGNSAYFLEDHHDLEFLYCILIKYNCVD